MGRLNNIFVSSHRVIDGVTFLLRIILAKISDVNEFYHLAVDIVGVIYDAKFNN